MFVERVHRDENSADFSRLTLIEFYLFIEIRMIRIKDAYVVKIACLIIHILE